LLQEQPPDYGDLSAGDEETAMIKKETEELKSMNISGSFRSCAMVCTDPAGSRLSG